ncbi:hypothetical protein [Streptomyces sp. NPDC059712]|uniref:hypothetical protein n=1 Tax=Streptomyces sp. NPDC059712 TaxID=3346919 RepID=UPI00367B16EF
MQIPNLGENVQELVAGGLAVRLPPVRRGDQQRRRTAFEGYSGAAFVDLLAALGVLGAALVDDDAGAVVCGVEVDVGVQEDVAGVDRLAVSQAL